MKWSRRAICCLNESRFDGWTPTPNMPLKEATSHGPNNNNNNNNPSFMQTLFAIKVIYGSQGGKGTMSYMGFNLTAPLLCSHKVETNMMRTWALAVPMMCLHWTYLQWFVDQWQLLFTWFGCILQTHLYVGFLFSLQINTSLLHFTSAYQ